MDVREIVEKLGLTLNSVVGDINKTIEACNSFHNVTENQLTFCKKDSEAELLKIKGCTIIISKTAKPSDLSKDNTYIMVDNPRLVFTRALSLLYPVSNKQGIHSTALIGENCEIGDRVYICAYVCIGNNVKIGNRCKIYSGVHIYDNVTIGDHVVINSGCVIGSDGFGYERNENKILEKFPHIGSVIIENGVEIGANTCIDRGTLDYTLIGEGTKIDNLVHIGHNARIGKHCVITAQCMIGRSIIGDYSWIGPGSCVLPGKNIGKGVFIGLGAVVTKDISDNTTVAGVPAREINEFKKYLRFIKNNI